MGMFLPNPRYERKFVAQGFTVAEALALVRRHRAGFRQTYPPRTVNNIYLDSPFRQAYHDHINGCPHRVKHRLRWYGAFEEGSTQAVLERKFKSGSVSGKDAYALGVLRLNGQPLAQSVNAACEMASLPESLKFEIRQLNPCLLNQYYRHYFVSGDGRFRLTVDSDFRFGSPHGPHAKLRAGNGEIPPVVLELKFDVQHALEAEAITRDFPMRMMRCSKFILGLASL